MRDLVKVGGLCGVLYFVSALAGTALVSATGVSERDMEVGDAARYLANMAADEALFVAAMWMYNVSNILLVPFAAGLHQVLIEYGTVLRLGFIAAVGWAVSFLIETMMTIGVAEGIAPTFVVATGGDQALLHAESLALIGFRNHTALLGGVLLGVAALLFGAAILKTRALPRWLGYPVLAAGALGLVGGLAPISVVFSLVRVLGLVVFVLWAAAAGVAMLRTRAPAEAQ